jgi:hypothetical protein
MGTAWLCFGCRDPEKKKLPCLPYIQSITHEVAVLLCMGGTGVLGFFGKKIFFLSL